MITRLYSIAESNLLGLAFLARQIWRDAEEFVAGGPDFIFVVGGWIVHDFDEVMKFEEGLAGGVELEF